MGGESVKLFNCTGGGSEHGRVNEISGVCHECGDKVQGTIVERMQVLEAKVKVLEAKMDMKEES